MNNITIRIDNIQPDPQDNRDWLLPVTWGAQLPNSLDLRDYCTNIEDQLNIGSCTANATVGIAEMFLKSAPGAGVADTDLSRLFNYYISRELIGPSWLTGDPGSTLRMALRAGNKAGIPLESAWAYDPKNENVKPPQSAYDDAANRKIGAYYRIPMIDPYSTALRPYTYEQLMYQFMFALAQGYPILAAIVVGASLPGLPAGEVYRPVNGYANKAIGGHALVIVGYSVQADGSVIFTVRNSWGSAWGDKGYFQCAGNALWIDAIDYWVVKSFAGWSQVGRDVTGNATPPTLSADQVRGAYAAMLGCQPATMDFDGARYWVNQPGAAVRDMYYAGMLRMQGLLDGSIKG